MTRCLMSLISVLCLLALGQPALAQPNETFSGTGEIELTVTSFGLGGTGRSVGGGTARGGSWTGILLSVRDLDIAQRNVLLRVHGFDPDGDVLLYDRVVTTNPGANGGEQSFWLYVKLPYVIDSSETIELRAYEAIESSDDTERSDLAFVPGRLLGSIEHRMQPNLVPLSTGLYGVVGELPLGLNYYSTRVAIGGSQQGDHPATSHELTSLVMGLTTAALPDAWQGYGSIGLLLWGQTGPGKDPGELNTNQAAAIREWVRRGGHLVVVLPSAGQEWTGSASNPIADMLPNARVSRLEGVSLEPYRSLLTTKADVRLPTSTTVHVFEPIEGEDPLEAMPILNGPDGQTVVIRRQHGLGAVTVIGFDLGVSMLRDTRMNTPRVLPEAEVFWNRVLGRRGMVSAVDAKSAGVQTNSFSARRESLVYDSEIAGEIAKSGTALQGLVLGVGVFFLYWIIAGPGGFGLLAKYKLKRFAWLGFLAMTAVFTFVAWSGALVLRPKSVEVSHLTMTLQVYGTGLEQARTWASVLIPEYGTARVELGREQGRGGLISPWEPASQDLMSKQKFPDNRSYRAEARSPDSMRVPSRQTVKQIEVDWVGAPRRGEISVLAKPGDVGQLEITHDEVRNWWALRGELMHDFPVGLEDVKIILVRGMNTIQWNVQPKSSYAGVQQYSLNTIWQPGTVLNLETLTNGTTLKRGELTGDLLFTRLLNNGHSLSSIQGSRGSKSDRLSALWVMNQMPPANFLKRGKYGTEDMLATRRMTHGLDLGRWFSQPSVIIIGHLVTSPSDAQDREGPIPLLVNGSPAPMSGRSVVAWVYPLATDPPSWPIPTTVQAPEPGEVVGTTPDPDSEQEGEIE